MASVLLSTKSSPIPAQKMPGGSLGLSRRPWQKEQEFLGCTWAQVRTLCLDSSFSVSPGVVGCLLSQQDC